MLRKLLDVWGKKKIVFTNGCFDIMHAGHVDYLEKAKKHGDKLIVGLNTDSSVRRLKGKSRPICDERSRARVLASLACVDAVIVFNDDTPIKLISLIKPHVLVKGAGYTIDTIVGASLVKKRGGKVITVPLVHKYSTSSIIKKIKNS